LTREAGVYISKTLFKNLYIPRSGKVGVFTNKHFKVTKKNFRVTNMLQYFNQFPLHNDWSFMLLMDAKYFFYQKADTKIRFILFVLRLFCCTFFYC